ncbi:MAG: hypothetical protein K2G58_01310, partial [Alistipes sp.]|nr:hypothetical protein [Alistipes sp.]
EWTKFADGKANLEIATMPSIDFGGAFAFVESYAHYCTEQLSSRAMYMLYARRFLDENERLRAEKALPKLLKAIASRQLSEGGFTYWPGHTGVHDWATSMVGEVMTEARRQGFAVSRQCYDRWKKYQNDAARRYRHTTDRAADLQQAYRLYTLALAGEEPAAAMNKLRESKSLSGQALLRLAAAYAVVGRKDVASKLVGRIDESTFVKGDYTTFWSPLRDQAMALEAWVWTGNAEQAFSMARKVSDKFSSTCCSTQEVAFVSVAMSRLADLAKGAETEIAIEEPSKKPLLLCKFGGVKKLTIAPTSGSVTVENRGMGELTASLLTSRRPNADETVAATAKGVTIEVHYTDLQGRRVNPDRLRQGEEFVAEIEVSKSGERSESMALTYAVPSGWEIWNERLTRGAANTAADYVDIRDERIDWYFSLAAGKTERFTVRLRAAYCGRFVLRPRVCEDLYDP